MKLELKHLAPYLPYGLKVSSLHTLHAETGIGNINQICKAVNLGKKQYLPILRPLSDLTKVEYWSILLEFLLKTRQYKSKYAKGHDDYCARIVRKPFGKIFKLQNHDEWVIIISLDEPDRCKDFIYNWLIKNHFDVFGLIDAGLAIDVNNIKSL